MTRDQIRTVVTQLRACYPDAVRVTLAVTHEEWNISLDYQDPTSHSIRQLNGCWAPRKGAAA